MSLIKLSDKRLEKRYVKAGDLFGDTVSYIYMGKCVGFDQLLKKWAKLEKEYAKRGYKTLSLASFVAYGGYGVELKGLGVKREKDEEPILHAEIYRRHCLKQAPPAVAPKELSKHMIVAGKCSLTGKLGT